MVSYLNTLPLVWGMLHGPQRGRFSLSFGTPAECADRLARGEADIGIVPSIELERQSLEIIEGTGIACRGAVLSILLLSKKPFAGIESLAGDMTSRTSIELARVILRERYGAHPSVRLYYPDLRVMLENEDAALLIGDQALRVDQLDHPPFILDLGHAWFELTGLPMVFAVWAARAGCAPPGTAQVFRDSCRFGLSRLEEIVQAEARRRGLSPDLALGYLSRHIVYELGPREYQGLRLFLDLARQPSEAGRLAARGA